MLPALPTDSVAFFSLLIFCLLLGLGLVVMAWRQPRRQWARAVAGVVAAGALWLTAFPPARRVPAARDEAVLLTEGYRPDSLRQLLRRLDAGTTVWRYGAAAASPTARPLASLLTLAEQKPRLRRVHVLGAGLPVGELLALGSLPIVPHQAPVWAGFRTAWWSPRLTLGEALLIEGTVALPPGAPAWVYLRAAGIVRDSARLDADGTFRLRYQPKTEGLDRYDLLLRRAGQLLATEPVPVEVTAPQRPAVLLLAAAPSFELKFLKNHLAEARHPVALRTTISRGLVQTDFVNQPARPLAPLTPALLARYAVVVADAASLAACSGPETQALNAGLRAGRLGLVLLAEAAPLPRATPGRADFALLPRPAGQMRAQPLTWPDGPAGVRAALPTQLRASAALRPLVIGPNQAMAAARRRVGSGFVVVSAVSETFPWVLQGAAATYASFWNRLLTAALPPTPTTATWRVAPRWPRPHQPLTLHLAAALPDSLPTVRALAGGGAVRLALRQDPRLPEWSAAQFWPSAAGWHQAHGPGRATHTFYVYPPTAWRGPELHERQQAMLQRAELTKDPVNAPPVNTVQSWPAGWFFALFLVAAGYLWLEEKL